MLPIAPWKTDLRFMARWVVLASVGLSMAWLAISDGTPDLSEEKVGGDTTVFEVGRNAFS